MEASMGPHFFKCGKTTKGSESGNSFRASMGPHFFKCGKLVSSGGVYIGRVCFNGAALFQVRKGEQASKRASWQASLQWGRTFSSAERWDDGDWKRDFILLQWGRTFSSAERAGRLFPVGLFSAASMGPHFFKCGKHRRRR